MGHRLARLPALSLLVTLFAAPLAAQNPTPAAASSAAASPDSLTIARIFSS